MPRNPSFAIPVHSPVSLCSPGCTGPHSSASWVLVLKVWATTLHGWFYYSNWKMQVKKHTYWGWGFSSVSSACLASARLWVRFPAPRKRKKKESRACLNYGNSHFWIWYLPNTGTFTLWFLSVYEISFHARHTYVVPLHLICTSLLSMDLFKYLCFSLINKEKHWREVFRFGSWLKIAHVYAWVRDHRILISVYIEERQELSGYDPSWEIPFALIYLYLS